MKAAIATSVVLGMLAVAPATELEEIDAGVRQVQVSLSDFEQQLRNVSRNPLNAIADHHPSNPYIGIFNTWVEICKHSGHRNVGYFIESSSAWIKLVAIDHMYFDGFTQPEMETILRTYADVLLLRDDFTAEAGDATHVITTPLNVRAVPILGDTAIRQLAKGTFVTALYDLKFFNEAHQQVHWLYIEDEQYNRGWINVNLTRELKGAR